MRTSTIVALLALFCIISVVFAGEGAAAVKAAAPAAPVVDNTQSKALQDKVNKLDADLSALRSTIAQIQQENKDLATKLKDTQAAAAAASKSAAAAVSAQAASPKEDQRVSKMDEAVNALRAKVEQLTKQIQQSTISAQVNTYLTTAKVFVTDTVAPKVDQGLKTTLVYAGKAQVALAPYIGQTQSHVSRVYHQLRAYQQQGKDLFTVQVAPIVKQLNFIPADKRSLTIEALWAAALFFALFTAFMICYSIWKLIFCTICGCGCERRSKKQQQVQKQNQKK